MKFVGLHAHTCASIGDGLNYPEDHFKFVVENAESESMALAITDHGNMNAMSYMLQAQSNLKKKGINFKPIFGNEFYLIPSIEQWKKDKLEHDQNEKLKKEENSSESSIEVEEESKEKKYFNPLKRRHHLVVLAQNQIGLKNLFSLTSLSHSEQNYYYYPRIDFNLLEKYNDGLIISSACLHPKSELITNFGIKTIKEVFDLWKSNEEIFVLSFNFDTKSLVFEKINWAGMTRKKASLLKLKTKCGKELKLTPDHKVYTSNRGWVEAQFLQKNDKIISL